MSPLLQITALKHKNTNKDHVKKVVAHFNCIVRQVENCYSI